MAKRMFFAAAKTAQKGETESLHSGRLSGEVAWRPTSVALFQQMPNAAPRTSWGARAFPSVNAPIQRKATVSVPSDPLEKAADEGAEKLLRMEEPALENGASGTIQRKCAACEDEDKIHAKREGGTNDGAAMDMSTAIATAERPGMPLPRQTRAYFEPRMRTDLGDVRIHADADAARAAAGVQAKAYTWRNRIVFGAGEYAPETHAGKRLLAHELMHVGQEGNGAALMRQSDPSGSGSAEPTLEDSDYRRLAYRIYEATMLEAGTDEEAVYTELLIVHNARGSFARLDWAFRFYSEKKPLVEVIFDEFSGEELDYVLELLGRSESWGAELRAALVNMGEEERIKDVSTPQRVRGVPSTPSEFDAAARRLHDAGPGTWFGTNEEAIFAVLTPLWRRPEMRTLEDTYYDKYGQTIAKMLEEEMLGTEHDFAQELLLHLAPDPSPSEIFAHVRDTLESMGLPVEFMRINAEFKIATTPEEKAELGKHRPIGKKPRKSLITLREDLWHGAARAGRVERHVNKDTHNTTTAAVGTLAHEMTHGTFFQVIEGSPLDMFQRKVRAYVDDKRQDLDGIQRQRLVSEALALQVGVWVSTYSDLAHRLALPGAWRALRFLVREYDRRMGERHGGYYMSGQERIDVKEAIPHSFYDELRGLILPGITGKASSDFRRILNSPWARDTKNIAPETREQLLRELDRIAPQWRP